MNKDGIILLDKASGSSSARAIAQLKKKLSLTKIGHAGTLDPLATGLLVCLVGKATRLARFAEQGDKLYTGTILFGRTTTTDDVCGDTIHESKSYPSLAAIENGVGQLQGEVWQVPPQVSALKLNGQRAYKIVRAGARAEVSARQVRVDRFEFSQINEDRISFQIACSKGTYIRALARDLGEILGCGACLEELRREKSFPFGISAARRLEEVEVDHILDCRKLLPDAPLVQFEPELIRRLVNGEQHTLEVIRPTLEDAIVGKKDALVFFGEFEARRPAGLLQRATLGWEFAANFGC